MKLLFVGSGFANAVIVERLKNLSQIKEIVVMDERPHTAGNCHTERCDETEVMQHVYGPHIFHTSNKEVWDYVQKFDEFHDYKHKVKVVHNNELFSFPINLHTISQFFKKHLKPNEGKKLLSKLGENIKDPKNFEEQALAFVGKDLYEAFFKHYSIKQWGCDPKEIPASVLKRIPIRFNHDDSYHFSKYGGIPKNGYSHIINKMLSGTKVNIKLNTKFIPSDYYTDKFDHIFYSGPIDEYFNYSHGQLGYRTVQFKKEIYNGDFQGCPQVNFCDANVPYTRITEHKHFAPFEKHDKTIIFKEFSVDTDENLIPYYPKRLPDDISLFKKYELLSKKEKNVTFIGRLAKYRYMDMHQIIDESISFSNYFINKNIYNK